MTIIQNYLSGLRLASRSLKMTTMIYVINLLFALALAIPFYSVITNAAHGSLQVNKLLEGFNYTTMQELTDSAKGSISLLFKEGIWLAILYLLLSIFLAGGILKTLDNGAVFKSKEFFANGSKFFFRFLRLTFYFILIHALVILIIYLPLSLILSTLGKNAESEKALFYAIIAGGGLHIIIFIYLLIIAHYTRFMIITEDTTKVWKKIWASVKFVSRKFFSTYPLYLLLLAGLVLLILVFKFLSGVVGMTTGFTIFIMFLLQQVFIWCRIWLKIWIYGGQLEYYLYNRE
ncbi:MAG: hypothetical protein IMY71_07715 [Bacteroidetes bacterium]|nr:hypothetical protein [Bacteroidota bacterium]